MKQAHILGISSFAVHGTASLKTLITILGERVLPVPSLILNGLTNMALVKKFEPPFAELLESTFELAADKGLELMVYIGYLGNGNQADIILNLINKYRSMIRIVITDPVCGDHGRKYVPQDVIEKWPAVIAQSDLIFPNLTELKILTGCPPNEDEQLENLLENFRQQYPTTKLVVTSIKDDQDNIGYLVIDDERHRYFKPMLPKNYGGSGDLFLSLFILNHYYKHLTFNDALIIAADKTYEVIGTSIHQNSEDLILSAVI